MTTSTHPRLPNRYRDIALIGVGTMGRVWRANDEHLGRMVAIKQIDRSRLDMGQLRSEVRIHNGLNHPGILRLLDVMIDRESVYLIHPFCSRGSLSDWIKQSPPWQSRFALFQQLLVAIVYLHSRSIVHGDIKPANVLVDDQGRPVLSDFGNATVISTGASAPLPLASDTSSWVGTPAYMAPELLHQTARPNVATDIYALGITLYELISSQRPFADDTTVAATQASQGAIPRLAVAHLPQRSDWDAIVRKASHTDPDQRYANVASFLHDVRAVLENRPIRAVRTPPWEYFRKWIRREPRLAALSVTMCVVLMLGWLLSMAAWRMASAGQRSADTERIRLEQSSTAIKEMQSKLSALIDEANTAKDEALRQKAIAVQTMQEIESFRKRSTSAEQDRIRKQIKSLIADQRLRNELAELEKQSEKAAFSTELTQQIDALKQKIESEELNVSEANRAIATMPEDPGIALEFLTQMERALEQNLPVVLGRVEFDESDTKVLASNIPLLPKGYFAFALDEPDTPRFVLLAIDDRALPVALNLPPATSQFIDLGTIPTTGANDPAFPKIDWTEWSKKLTMETIESFPPSLLETLPPDILVRLPLQALSLLSSNALAQLPIEILAELPSESLEKLPNDVLVQLPVEALTRIRVDFLGTLPVEFVLKLPSEIMNTLPSNALQGLPISDQSRLPLNVILRLPNEARERLPRDFKADGVGPLTITNSIGMNLRLLPPGKFPMAWIAGSPTVTLTKHFYIGTYEVTQGEYAEVIGSNPSHFKNLAPNHPVESVTWREAIEFCRRLSARREETEAGRVYRLPSAAEWEYACRAGTTTKFYFGDSEQQLGAHAWMASTSNSRTHPVGSLAANPWGLHDMFGNVWEMCQDWQGAYSTTELIDPQGPTTGTLRAGRGGCWFSPIPHCELGFHGEYQPDSRTSHIGFRVVLMVPQDKP